jgi:GH25 family lysozyme M1 (1,4-beta-N-acetylmuramidase)
LTDPRPQGIDVSQWQGDITNVLKGKQFAFARASIGNGYDKSFAAHLADMKREGIVTGAYHYATYGPGPTRQATLFLKYALDAEILALDAESSVLRYPKTIKAIMVNIRNLDPRNRPIALYSSEGTWPGNMTQDINWVANWSREPKLHWTFWQKRGAPLDLDVFNGTLAQLHTLAGR